VLTGFKWIAELIKEKEASENYIIGGEESYGLMVGSKLRDKDAVSAVAILCEMAAYERSRGKTLFDKLLELYVQFGYYQEHLISITKKGRDGQQQIADMMERFRAQPPATLDGVKVSQLLDYEQREKRDLATGSVSQIELPKSNVLQFILEDGSKISARPSGTEPKIKFYFSVNAPLQNVAAFENVKQQLSDKINRIIADMKL
jgi:phosphoglucomutase